MALFELVLVVGGLRLIVSGGSWFYLFAGIAILATAVLVGLGRSEALSFTPPSFSAPLPRRSGTQASTGGLLPPAEKSSSSSSSCFLLPFVTRRPRTVRASERPEVRRAHPGAHRPEDSSSPRR
jgi:hypothetical protein